MAIPTVTYQVIVPAGGQLLVNIMEVYGPHDGSYSYEVRAFSDPNRGEAFAGAVPEPTTWGMMLLGFGAVGFAIRRCRKPSQVTFGKAA